MGNVKIISNIEPQCNKKKKITRGRQGIPNNEGKRKKGDISLNSFEYPSISYETTFQLIEKYRYKIFLKMDKIGILFYDSGFILMELSFR